MNARGSWRALVPLLLCVTPAGATDWNLHGQFTGVTQYHPSFHAPYSGANSLDAAADNATTLDATLFAGVSLWRDAALYANLELDQGFGLSNTLGIAGFPSGEAYKVGADKPYWRVPRLFLREVFPWGAHSAPVPDAANQLPEGGIQDGLVLTIGKFSIVDLFDTNVYAHDPRADFLNWAVIDSGAFDYAADAWGYTTGVAIEGNRGRWSLRAGLFNLSRIPNGKTTEPHFQQYSTVVELERRMEWDGQPGKVKALVYLNRGRMGRYRDALAFAATEGGIPDTAMVRRDASRTGFALNVEQAIRESLGAFLRLSANDGSKEAFEFTDINRSLAVGVSAGGRGWRRPEDQSGVAVVISAVSGGARRYFELGGLGILVGDGQLPAARTEQILEGYYRLQLLPSLALTLDMQHVRHPAYSRDRGSVNIAGVRVHAEF